MSKGRKPSGKTYEIGYGQPPKASQFKPGQSGNPKGRPKKPKGLLQMLRRVYYDEIAIRENGGSRKIPAGEAIFLQSRNKALKGDQKATDTAIKALQVLEASEADEAAGIGMTPEQIAEFDRTIMDEFRAMSLKPKSLPKPRKRSRKKDEDNE